MNRRPIEPTSGQADPYTIFHYDENGRVDYRERRHDATTLRKLAFVWDSDDRLKRVWRMDTLPTPTSIFNALYDEDGLRVQKTDTWTGTHDFSWGPGGIVHDTGGTSYTPGLHQRVGTTDRFFHSDWLGSTRYLSDSAGTGLPSALRYDAFGNRSATSGPDDPTDFQFAGALGYQQEYQTASEPGLGLQYLEQRYYDPAVGRFISPDPIGFAGGLNLYAYTENAPTLFVDPTGYGWRKTTLTVIGGFLGGLAGAPEGGIGAVPGAAAGAGFGSYLGGRIEGESIPRALKSAAVDTAVTYVGGKAGSVVATACRARKVQKAAELVASRAPVVSTLTRILLQRAGFSEVGTPLIIDPSLGVDSTAVAQALRAMGFNARSVREVFGTGATLDVDTLRLARTLGARVVASDRGRDLAGGFFELTIQVPQRIRNVANIARLIEQELRPR